MITNRNAKATTFPAMTEAALTSKLGKLGYYDGAIEAYIADAKRGGIAHLLGLETIRYNQNTGTFSFTIPVETIAADNVVKGMKISHDKTGPFIVDQITTEASGSIRFMTPVGTYHYFKPETEVDLLSDPAHHP